MRSWPITLFFLIILLLNGQSYAQATITDTIEVVVLLNSGGKMQGKIITDIPGDKIVIERRDGQIFEFSYDKIDSIASPDDYKTRQLEILANPKGVSAVVPTAQVRMVFGSTETIGVSGPYGVSGMVGKSIADRVLLGGGAGWLAFSEMDFSFLSFAAEAQYHVTAGAVGLFFYGRGGWALGWVDQESGSNWGGANFGFGIGVFHTFSDHIAMSMAVGYSGQAVKDGHPGFPDNADHISMELGVLF